MYIHASLRNREDTVFENPDFPLQRFRFAGDDTLPHWHAHAEFIRMHAPCRLWVNGSPIDAETGELYYLSPGAVHGLETFGTGAYEPLVVGAELLRDTMGDSLSGPLLERIFQEGNTPVVRLWTPRTGKMSDAEEVDADDEESDGTANDSGAAGTASDADAAGTAGDVGDADQADTRAILRHFEAVCRECVEHRDGWKIIAKVELSALFARLARCHPETAEPMRDAGRLTASLRIIRAELGHVSHHFEEALPLPDAARRAGMSVQHFSRVFRAVTGRTYVDHVNGYRLDMAMQLLAGTDLPVSQIPEKTGFCNANYFSRVFRARTGMTPSAWRKSHLRAILR